MDLPINPGRLTPGQVYRLSLDVGVSYRAVVNHLATLHKIRWDDTDLLRDEAPKDIKIDIGRGVRPEDVRADAWPLEERDAGKVLHPRVNDELHVFLPELPGSGYIWEVVGPTLDRQAERSASRDADDAPFALVRTTFQTSVPDGAEERLGAKGMRYMVFRILRPGRHTLRLIKRRPWERARIPQAAFEVKLQVAPRPTGTGDQGLSERQKPLLTLAA